PRKDLPFPPNFIYIIKPQHPHQIQLQPINNPLILHPHHHLNPSTFTPTLSLPTLSHIYSGITPPIPALKPPLH
ncbi:citrate/2-methylcitrate synthase, partial [Siminovitchia fortis]|uniref:citrate/2-methylcitrate synthase n=1 Tax=Siminovitchia fortis TaxID=254758 RepID=UPI0036F3E9D9